MRNWLINIFSLFIIASLFSACKKEKNEKTAETENITETGNIKVSIQYQSPSGSAYIWTWNSTTVELFKDWEVIATLHTTPSNPIVDFGSYEYGENYSVRTSAKVIRKNPSSGQTFTNNAVSDIINFKVDKPTVIVNNYVQIY